MNHDLQIKFRQAFDSPIPSNELKSIKNTHWNVVATWDETEEYDEEGDYVMVVHEILICGIHKTQGTCLRVSIGFQHVQQRDKALDDTYYLKVIADSAFSASKTTLFS